MIIKNTQFVDVLHVRFFISFCNNYLKCSAAMHKSILKARELFHTTQQYSTAYTLYVSKITVLYNVRFTYIIMGVIITYTWSLNCERRNVFVIRHYKYVKYVILLVILSRFTSLPYDQQISNIRKSVEQKSFVVTISIVTYVNTVGA